MSCTFNCNQGRLCTCGVFHANGGRTVDTQTHEAPRARMPITFATDEGTLAESVPEVNVLARCAQIACLAIRLRLRCRWHPFLLLSLRGSP
jgi:hypothetical protein